MGYIKWLNLLVNKPTTLKLPQTMKIHDMFHVSLLESYDKAQKSNVLSPLSINVESKDKYKVKKILNSKNHYGKLQYFVK